MESASAFGKSLLFAGGRWNEGLGQSEKPDARRSQKDAGARRGGSDSKSLAATGWRHEAFGRVEEGSSFASPSLGSVGPDRFRGSTQVGSHVAGLAGGCGWLSEGGGYGRIGLAHWQRSRLARDEPQPTSHWRPCKGSPQRERHGLARGRRPRGRVRLMALEGVLAIRFCLQKSTNGNGFKKRSPDVNQGGYVNGDLARWMQSSRREPCFGMRNFHQ